MKKKVKYIVTCKIRGRIMNKKILLINDMPGYGKVALAAMTPILSTMGHSLYNLPTALVSNTLDYGKFEIMDTTEYMEKSLKIWEDRKSTRLNSSHANISYAVFCLKKKTK